MVLIKTYEGELLNLDHVERLGVKVDYVERAAAAITAECAGGGRVIVSEHGSGERAQKVLDELAARLRLAGAVHVVDITLLDAAIAERSDARPARVVR